MTGFERVRRSSAAEDAARSIQEMILAGSLVPGQRLPAERDLCERLGISRPTLRETIRSLVGLNILESRHGAGTFVAPLDTAALLEPLAFVMALDGRTAGQLFEARLVLEPALAALAAQRATDEQLAAIRAAARRFRTAHAAPRDGETEPSNTIGGVGEVMAADVELHRLIAEAAGNPLLATMLGALGGLGRASRAVTSQQPGVVRGTVADHAAIVKALERRDPQAAREAMAKHLRRVAAAADWLDHFTTVALP